MLWKVYGRVNVNIFFAVFEIFLGIMMPGLWHFRPLTERDIEEGIPGIGPPPKLDHRVCIIHAGDEQFVEIRRRAWLLYVKNYEMEPRHWQSFELDLTIIQYLENSLEREFGAYIRQKQTVCSDCNSAMIYNIWVDLAQHV